LTHVYLQAEEWYRKNAEMLARHFANVEFRSNAGDAPRGKVHFALTAETLLATVTLWNKGDVEVQVLKKGSPDLVILHDRRLAASEYIPSLLDGYICEILALA
jgi:hypothetical protein